MVYCQDCGTNNDDTADQCSNCGASLRSRRRTPRRAGQDECFGFSGGALPGLVIGAIIIIVGVTSVFGGNFGEMMGTWGEGFGEGMGRWGEGFGEGMGRWGEGVGRFFADWGMGWGGKIGASFSIIIGLAILYYFVYGRGRR